MHNDCTLVGLQLTAHLADSPRTGPALHELDVAALEAWVASPGHLPVDYVNVSFCRNAQDVRTVRAALDRCATLRASRGNNIICFGDSFGMYICAFDSVCWGGRGDNH